MSQNINVCKKCKKEIEEGKYCKMCLAERKENRDKVLKTGGKLITGALSIALTYITKKKLDGDGKA